MYISSVVTDTIKLYFIKSDGLIVRSQGSVASFNTVKLRSARAASVALRLMGQSDRVCKAELS